MFFGDLGPEFKKLWASRTVSNLGDGMTLVAGPLLAASLTRDPFLISGLAFAQRLPWLLFALVSGALVDRLDRKRLMAAVDFFRSAAVGFLGIAVLLDYASLPLMYAVFFMVGTAETLFDTASVSVLPAVVRKEDLAKANGRLYSAQILANNRLSPGFGESNAHAAYNARWRSRSNFARPYMLRLIAFNFVILPSVCPLE
ncbi:MAG: MFS transporter [Rubrobacteraceae bacterium]